MIAASQLLAAPCIIGVLLAPTARDSYGLLFLAYLTAETWLGPAAAVVQVRDIIIICIRGELHSFVQSADTPVSGDPVQLQGMIIVLSIARMSQQPSPISIFHFVFINSMILLLQDICMPAMRAQASAVYIGIITIVASTGPVIVSRVYNTHKNNRDVIMMCLQIPALLDWVSTFYRCTSGLKYSLLIVVPSLYLCSSLLFLVLGVVTVWWERRRRKGGHYSMLTTPPSTSGTADGTTTPSS